jgi:hypothetical protein
MSETTTTPEARSPEAPEGELNQTTRQLQQMRGSDPARPALLAKRDLLSAEQVAAREARQAEAPDPLAPVQSPDEYRVIQGDLPPGVDVADPGLKQGKAFGVEFELPQTEFRGVMMDASHLARVEQRGGDPVAAGWKQHVAMFGSKQAAEEAVAKAQTVLAKRPDLVAWLDATGLANSARVTAILARRAK